MNYYQPYGFQQPYQMYQSQQPQFMAQPQTQVTQQPQQIQQPQQSQLLGKVVDGIELVKAYDLPIGSSGVFPKADGSEIYIKSWNQNGTTQITEYVAKKSDEDTKTTSLEDILEIVTAMSKKIDKLEKKSSSTPRRKGVIDDDE